MQTSHKLLIGLTLTIILLVGAFGIPTCCGSSRTSPLSTDATVTITNQSGTKIKLSIVQGDLFEVGRNGAIVNPANEHLQHGGGIAKAIVDRAGEALQQESTEIISRRGPIPVGEIAITEPYKLKGTHNISTIIHAVGPRGSDPDREKKLRQVHANIIFFCGEHNIKKVAIPAISTGIFGYDAKDAAPVAVNALIDSLKNYHPLYPSEVIIVVPEADKLEHYLRALAQHKKTK